MKKAFGALSQIFGPIYILFTLYNNHAYFTVKLIFFDYHFIRILRVIFYLFNSSLKPIFKFSKLYVFLILILI